jgi:hypothetical protein
VQSGKERTASTARADAGLRIVATKIVIRTSNKWLHIQIEQTEKSSMIQIRNTHFAFLKTYSLQVSLLTARGSYPGRGKRIFPFTKTSTWALRPTHLLFIQNRGSNPEINRPGVILPTHVHLVPRIRMNGAIPLLPLYTFTAWTGMTLPFTCNSG